LIGPECLDDALTPHHVPRTADVIDEPSTRELTATSGGRFSGSSKQVDTEYVAWGTWAGTLTRERRAALRRMPKADAIELFEAALHDA